jgi:small subunit ribosomal protein S16
MLSIRLTRTGRRNKPMFRLVISEKSKPPKSRALEILGHYNPHSKELQVKEDRIKYWLENGSDISPSANNLLVEKGILESEKKKTLKLKNKKREELKKKSEEKQKSAETEPEATEAPASEEEAKEDNTGEESAEKEENTAGGEK